ncbi:MAG TPA: sensor histidine kinase [Acidobacteriaceae bacterium]
MDEQAETIEWGEEVECALPSRSAAGSARPLWARLLFSHHLWLLFSLFFFAQPYVLHSFRAWALALSAWLLFLLLYIGAHTQRGLKHTASLVCMLLLGICYLPINEGSIGIFIYFAAAAAAAVRSSRLLALILSFQCFCVAFERFHFHLDPWILSTGILIPLIVGVTVFSEAQQRRSDARLRLAHEEIEHLAKRAERERIARDMHDVLGHTLSMIVLKSELAGRLIHGAPAKASKEIGDIERTARHALSEVRQAIGGYRAESLAAELERTQRTLSTAGLHLVCNADPLPLRPADETVLSLIVREAVTNIVRHANARECRLSIENQGDHALLVISDDGRGGVRQEGNGLRGMRERVEARGGKFMLSSENGTQLKILLPLEQPS